MERINLKLKEGPFPTKIVTQKSGNGISFKPKKIVLSEEKFEVEEVEKISKNKGIGKLIHF